MRHSIVTFLSILTAFVSNAQVYDDYIGAGHVNGITISASSSMQGTSPEATLDGSGLDDKYMAASRFLSQAAVAYDPSHVEEVMEIGYEQWIDNQMSQPAPNTEALMWSIWQDILNEYHAMGEDTSDIFGPYSVHFNYTLWTQTMSQDALLRHRVAQALSEILVISMQSDIGNWAEGVSAYYDLLLQNAFGNYKDLLLGVTKSPMMGVYLSHYNNPKTNLNNNIRPDENYAREIMQLFSIGLVHLNIDGTPKLDVNGNVIPTYDNTDIKELAKVFTGMGAGAILDPTEWPYVPIFGVGTWAIDKTVPMAMYQSDHEPGPKVILKDITINIPGNGMAEVDAAVDYLFNHPNVGPFLALRMIQRLVKSNPSPSYIASVAQVFNNNGAGVRGDLGAMVKAILLHPEAREGEYMALENAGMIRPPFLRYAQYMRTIEKNNASGKWYHNGFSIQENTGHWPFLATSVFNFYTPDYAPPGDVLDAGLVAPELKIHNTSSAIKDINQSLAFIYWSDDPTNMYSSLWGSWNNEIDTRVHPVYDEYLAMSEDIEKLINTLDKRFMHGQLTEITRDQMRQRLTNVYWGWDDEWKLERVKMALYMMVVSPDYVTLK